MVEEMADGDSKIGEQMGQLLLKFWKVYSRVWIQWLHLLKYRVTAFEGQGLWKPGLRKLQPMKPLIECDL